jgi:type IV pilus assembly protein PilQ
MKQCNQMMRFFFAAVALWLGFASAHAQQNSIDAFNVSAQAGRVVLRLTMKEPLGAAPASFTVSQPARIAFDFPSTTNALGRANQEVNEGELRSVNLVQVGNRTRLVLNLRNMVGYETQVSGKTLDIVLTPTATTTARTTPRVERFAEGTVDSVHAVRDIDFRRGKGGEGRVVVDLSDTTTGIDIRQQGQSLIVDLLKTKLPENLRKRLDVQDFATPVSTISTFQQGENVRMVIEPRGLWEHNAYQTDTQFVVEVKPVQYDPNKLVQGTRGGYRGEKLSLNFQSVEVRSVLNVIADFTDLNIITSDTVQGSLTLRLKDVPWDQALDLIMQTRGLDMRKNGNVVWIAPRDELATKEKLELEAQQQISDLEPLRTETFQLNYTKADQIATLLRGGGSGSGTVMPMMSKRGSVVFDARTNTLFVQDIPARLEAVRKVIVTTDVPVRQVMIEARIVEASDSFGRVLGARLGTHWLQAGNSLIGNHKVDVGGSIVDTGFHTGQGAPTPNFLTDALSVNLPADPTRIATGTTPGQFSVVLFNNAATRFLNLEISALEADGKGKIISSPRVVTANQIEALIEQGTEIPFQQATSSGATSVTFRKAVLALRVKPQITPDGNVLMDVDVNKDAPSTSVITTAGIVIDTKHVKTSVLVENGGTAVIGGIYTQTDANRVNKVPFFGDLPGVGPLFRNYERSDNKTELLIFLTPRIIDERLSVR